MQGAAGERVKPAAIEHCRAFALGPQAFGQAGAAHGPVIGRAYELRAARFGYSDVAMLDHAGKQRQRLTGGQRLCRWQGFGRRRCLDEPGAPQLFAQGPGRDRIARNHPEGRASLIRRETASRKVCFDSSRIAIERNAITTTLGDPDLIPVVSTNQRAAA